MYICQLIYLFFPFFSQTDLKTFMFVKKFIERKPVRTAIKRILGAEQNKDVSTPDNTTDIPPEEIAKNLRTMTEILNTFKVDNRYICQIYTVTEGIPDGSDIYGLSKQINDSETFSLWWSSYIISNSSRKVTDPLVEPELVFLPYFIRQVNVEPSDSNQMFITNTDILDMSIQSLLYFPGLWIMDVAQEFKKIPNNFYFGLQDIRSIFKRIYYDLVPKYITKLQEEYRIDENQSFLFFLQDDISWINSKLGIVTPAVPQPIDWETLGVQQYPRWYDNLGTEMKKLFVSETKKAGMSINNYLIILSNVLNVESVNEVIQSYVVETPNTTEEYQAFLDKYNLLLKEMECLLHCVCIDHKMQFWYRPFTEDLECTADHAFWSDLNSILVDYELEYGEDIVFTISCLDFIHSIENGNINKNLKSLTLKYNMLDFSDLLGEINTTTSDWEDKILSFRNKIDGYVGSLPQRILNLNEECLTELYDVLYYDDNTQKGFLTWINNRLNETYTDPYTNTDGLLIANGILAPRWQIIYDCFNAIVTKNEENENVYYPNVDFETLLKSENAPNNIAQAVWKPWYALLNVINNSEDNIIFISDLEKDYNYNIYYNKFTYLVKQDISNDETLDYIGNSGQYYWSNNVGTKVIEGQLQDLYTRFYAKMPFFDAHELKCLFYQLKLWSTSYRFSHIIGAFGDFQLWSTFLDFNAYIDATEHAIDEITHLETPLPVLEIRKNYHILVISIEAHIDYECIDPYKNISHLEAYFATQTEEIPGEGESEESFKFRQFKASNCFVRTFGTRLIIDNSTSNLYDFDSRFTTNLIETYKPEVTELSDQIYARVNKRYSKNFLPSFEDWVQDWLDITENAPSYFEISKDNPIDT